MIPWILPEDKNYGSSRIDNALAIKSGLKFRDLKTSVREIQEWWVSDTVSQSRRDAYEQKPASVLARENEILAAWAAYKK